MKNPSLQQIAEPDVASEMKTVIVDAISTLPTYFSQRVAAFIVRAVWPAFRNR